MDQEDAKMLWQLLSFEILYAILSTQTMQLGKIG